MIVVARNLRANDAISKYDHYHTQLETEAITTHLELDFEDEVCGGERHARPQPPLQHRQYHSDRNPNGEREDTTRDAPFVRVLRA